MKFPNVLERHRALMRKNWRALAESQFERLYGIDPKKEYLLMPGANATSHERIHWQYRKKSV